MVRANSEARGKDCQNKEARQKEGADMRVMPNKEAVMSRQMRVACSWWRNEAAVTESGVVTRVSSGGQRVTLAVAC